VHGADGFFGEAARMRYHEKIFIAITVGPSRLLLDNTDDGRQIPRL